MPLFLFKILIVAKIHCDMNEHEHKVIPETDNTLYALLYSLITFD